MCGSIYVYTRNEYDVYFCVPLSVFVFAYKYKHSNNTALLFRRRRPEVKKYSVYLYVHCERVSNGPFVITEIGIKRKYCAVTS